MKPTHLSLFTGIGGIDLAAEKAGFKTVGQVEYADFPTKVLEKHWPNVARWRDIHDFTADDFIRKTGIERPTLITGGPPCQPISVAGRREAAGDSRNMWPQFIRVIRDIRPRWVVAENPTGIISAQKFKGNIAEWPKGEFFGEIVRDIAALGYSVGWGVWGACDVENHQEGASLPTESAGCAPHIRERLFIVAYSESRGRNTRRPEQPRQQGVRKSAWSGAGEILGDTSGAGCKLG